MTDSLLISHRWKTLGWILSIPALIAGMYLLSTDNADFIPVTIPVWAEKFFWIDTIFANKSVPKVIYLFDELVAMTLFTGLLLLAFSKEKEEDEWIQSQRLSALQWAVLFNTIVLMLFTIFVHGLPFLQVMVYNMFTPLLIFVARFYYIVYLKPRFQTALHEK